MLKEIPWDTNFSCLVIEVEASSGVTMDEIVQTAARVYGQELNREGGYGFDDLPNVRMSLIDVIIKPDSPYALYRFNVGVAVL